MPEQSSSNVELCPILRAPLHGGLLRTAVRARHGAEVHEPQDGKQPEEYEDPCSNVYSGLLRVSRGLLLVRM